jgi:hypothetical protein
MKPKTPKPKPPVRSYKPNDYLRGSKRVGGSYTAFDTYGQGRPDFGKGPGPGEPYHEVQKKVAPMPKWAGSGSKSPKWAPGVNIGSSNVNPSTQPANIGSGDPRIDAIRRRLRGL